MKVNTYASERGYGNFCDACIQRESENLVQVELVCETDAPCAGCSEKE